MSAECVHVNLSLYAPIGQMKRRQTASELLQSWKMERQREEQMDSPHCLSAIKCDKKPQRNHFFTKENIAIYSARCFALFRCFALVRHLVVISHIYSSLTKPPQKSQSLLYSCQLPSQLVELLLWSRLASQQKRPQAQASVIVCNYHSLICFPVISAPCISGSFS